MNAAASDGSIYGHILAHLPAEGSGLKSGGDVLPDDPRPDDDTVRWAPGLIDHILDRGTDLSAEQTAESLLRGFIEAAHDPAAGEPYVGLYRQLVEVKELGFLDPFARRVIEARLPRRNVRSVALRLVTESPERLPVKVGIALLGMCARREDQRILVTIGRHPEFTDYAGMAIRNAFGPRDDVLWELAKVTEGWGRVALVQQLASTDRPEIKAWILRETGRDHLLLHEASLVAAQTGELRKELEASEIDDELCLTAGAILEALIQDQPYETRDSIDDYPDGPEAITRYLFQLARRPERLESIQPLMTILDYLELRGGVDWNLYAEYRERLVADFVGRPLVGWAEEERAHVATRARWVLQRPGWRRAIDDGLRSTDPWVFYLAQRAATRLGDDVYPVLLERLRQYPDANDITWQDAARAADEVGFDDLLEVALARLSEHRPYAGWIFPDWLRAVLDGLERFPDKGGWPLIREGLTSPEMMERRFGITGLQDLGTRPWPSEALGLLVALLRSEPDEDNREMAAELLEDHGYPGRMSTP